MKVADLVEQLLQFDQELDVVIASDGEGNSFAPLSGFGTGMYVPEASWYGYLKDPEGCDEDEEYKENAIVFWPS